MTKEEVELIIAEQNKSKEEILKAIVKVKANRDGYIAGAKELEQENAELKNKCKKIIQELIDFIKSKENGDGRHPTPLFYKSYEDFLKELKNDKRRFL